MEPTNYKFLKLTSNVLSPSVDGNYSFEHAAFLLPHEAIRRELIIAEKAVNNLDCSSFPWMISILKEWVVDFFVPIVFSHHYIEDHIIFPFYFQLGIILPERIAEDHISLINRMNHLKVLLNELLEFQSNNTGDIAVIETTIKKHFLDLKRELEANFAEEEKFWPSIIAEHGEKNWAKVEHLILNHIAQFGEMNAGDPFRMLMCSKARAMGIVSQQHAHLRFPDVNDNDDSNSGPWASTELQSQFLTFHHSLSLKTWFTRYAGYSKLITTIAHPADYNASQFTLNALGKYVSKLPKKPIWFILFLVLTAYYCLGTGPYYAANSFPLRNLPYLHIKVINYDVNGLVGSSFLSFLHHVEESSNTIPTFRYEEDVTVSIDAYKQRVMHGEAWGALFVLPNATEALLSAFAQGCQQASGYDPTNALYFAWDEGRNNQVATPQIAGFSRNLLIQFQSQFAIQYLSSLSNNTITNCVSQGYASLLVTPIAHTETNMSPVSISPVAVAAITIGNILMGVFGSLFVVNATMNGTAALVEDCKTPQGKIVLQCSTMAFIGLGIAIAYATFVVGLTKAGSGNYIYTGQEWVQIVAIQWLHVMIWSYFHGFVFVKLGPGYVPFSFGILLLYSIIGGWNTDLSDPGYKAFFQIFPFHWSIYVLKYIFFKSLGYHRGISCGILIAYWICTLTAFVMVSLQKEYDHLADKPANLHVPSGSKPLQVATTGTAAVTAGGGGVEPEKVIPVNMSMKSYELVQQQVV